MNEKIRFQLEELSNLMQKENMPFLILALDRNTKELHSFKNCIPNDQALLMTNYIEGMPEVDEAFTAQILHMQTYEENKTSEERPNAQPKKNEA